MNKYIKSYDKNNFEKFCKKAREIHGDKYSYDVCYYVNIITKTNIKCNSCGENFKVTPRRHLSKNGGCPNCTSRGGQEFLDKFIGKLTDIHGDKYDYSMIVYKNNKTPVKLKCNKCDTNFEQTPVKLVRRKYHCPICDFKSKIKVSIDEFIKRAKIKHGDDYYDYYDYSKINYVDLNTKISIRCNKCGVQFQQKLRVHLENGHECRTFSKYTNDEWIMFAKITHGDTYDYSRVEFISSSEPVTIGCKIHGWFDQRPTNHIISKIPCKKCRIKTSD
ncbi:hypothetical protein QJ850_gp865 [Acanthamoeba polyphaga mimivirus]|uniref:C2H2-type domain-containing protein n=1 Tax=Acanthamoeba polyphaga mimivirus Kroon TaxID=3069720 RepID=A0A0G2Y5H8_9VIRU|nr:hypothetical protein QJ850_gp865 [Acanthamoeba polyphaga mimivirus]AKI79834.1 hypothetical protein [Acanthamoeba polyphaga mimivirus Kroon]